MLIACVCLIILATPHTNAGDFSYDDSDGDGPTLWHKHYPRCGELKEKQSPIDIQTNDVIEQTYLPFKFSPNVVHKMKIENNGHTIQMTFEDPHEEPVVTGGPLEAAHYKFVQFHFHWHSETRVNSKIFPLEMHMVFYNMIYPDAKAAMNSDDPEAMLVLATLFRTQNKKVQKKDAFTKKFSQIVHCKQSAVHDFHGTAFTKFLPDSIKIYFTYDGSLTTPPCNAITKWVVFKMIKPISNWQMERFGHIRDNKNKVLKRNWRDVQKLNDRKVFISRPFESD